MKVIVFDTYKEMSSYAADIYEKMLKENPARILGLATGSTPVGLYKELAERYKEGRISFKDCITYNLDEYCGITPENEQSYKYFMDKNLFDYTDFKKENLHIPNAYDGNFEEVGKAYDEEIEAKGRIDLQLLGIGLNGHIGFNEPDDHFTKETHLVNLTQSTIEANSRFFDDIKDVPTKAFTMGMYSIMTSKKILMIINGEKKYNIFKKATEGPVTPMCPASLLQLHPDVTVLYSKE